MAPTETRAIPSAAQLRSDIAPFLAELEERVAEQDRLSDVETLYLKTYLGEARVGLDALLEAWQPGDRVLEIGAGLGVLGRFLHEQGVDYHGTDPGHAGFSVMVPIEREIGRACADRPGFSIARKSALDLDAANDGAFDLIFSFHVLEHLPDLEGAFAAMSAVLAPEGRMLHVCPNYRFPYDPHFGAIMPFWSPTLCRVFNRRRVQADPDLWDSLNFIGAGDVRRLARQQGMRAQFQAGVMARTLRRLSDDEMFRMRHAGPAGRLADWVRKSPVFAGLEHWPASWASPMIVSIRR